MLFMMPRCKVEPNKEDPGKILVSLLNLQTMLYKNICDKAYLGSVELRNLLLLFMWPKYLVDISLMPFPTILRPSLEL